jgi:hypothetical protein
MAGRRIPRLKGESSRTSRRSTENSVKPSIRSGFVRGLLRLVSRQGRELQAWRKVWGQSVHVALGGEARRGKRGGDRAEPPFSVERGMPVRRRSASKSGSEKGSQHSSCRFRYGPGQRLDMGSELLRVICRSDSSSVSPVLRRGPHIHVKIN